MKIPVLSRPRGFAVEELPDLGPPIKVFRGLVSEPYPFILESSLVDSTGKGRFTFLGSRPFLTLAAKGDRVTLTKKGEVHSLGADPFSVLKKILSALRVEGSDSRIPFPGGAVGYFAYDLCHFIEKLPATASDDLGLPDLQLGFYDRVLAYDQAEKRWFLSILDPQGGKISEVKREVLARVDRSLGDPAHLSRGGRKARSDLISNFNQPDYLHAVRRIISYIETGDVYQVNLSQRFSSPVSYSPFSLYLRLRERNPSYFGGFLGFPEFAIVSSSPERFLKVDDRKVETCPIKGTRRRGQTPEEDGALRRELGESIKDRAELNMIVDLERNDLGRVCEYGTVRVKDHAEIETHPTVFHLVSTIAGEMREGLDVVDLLRATFPGGSITGAPKIRAMEIIDELEPNTRSVYTGSIGYISLDGQADLNIVIRTILIKAGTAYYHVGGGIVADSDPEAEYEETLVKGRALKEVIEE